jgi:hypothetical protein
MEPRGVTLQKAGEIIGGDKPLSKRTVSAMIARGDLEAYGERGGRRVTMRSIRAYQEGGRGQWHDESDASDGSPGAAILHRFPTAARKRTIQNRRAGISSSDAIQPLTPKGGWRT